MHTVVLAVVAAMVASMSSSSDGPHEPVYLLTYFRTSDEALHLAWSTDGLRWTALNGNRAVLRADAGNRSIRDPFVRRGPDGWYHLVCSNSWNSTSILYTRSHDLIQWAPWRVVPVMEGVPGADNAWAPEFVWDPSKKEYVVFWASVTGGCPNQRIWYTTTRDFERFARPALLLDPGYSVIDATMVQRGSTWYMAYKDERGENRIGTDYKSMRVATAASPTGPYAPKTGLVSPALTEGPAVFRVNKRWLMLYDRFTEGAWGASVSDDLITWRKVDGIVVPNEARHGNVLQITRRILERLQLAYPERQ